MAVRLSLSPNWLASENRLRYNNLTSMKESGDPMRTAAFIGTGNMGGALASAAVRSVPKTAVFLANRTVAKAQALAEKLKTLQVQQ